MDLKPVALLGGALLIGVGVAYFGAQAFGEPPRSRGPVTSGPAQALFAESESDPPGVQTVLPFDAIPAIFEPEFEAGSSAKLPADHPVIGLALGGEARAYSIPLLDAHEIVNDVVGGQKVITTW